MKFRTTPAFDRDYRHLKPEHARAFRESLPAFSAVCDGYATQPGSPWPAALRVAPMAGTRGIWEMTWSFASPDGRATFEFVVGEDKLWCQWRRVGDHDVFRRP